MEHERTSADVAQRQRSLRFSKLPEPIRLKDTVEERQRSLRFSKLPESIRSRTPWKSGQLWQAIR
ncbi:hypothetical protein ACFRAI_42500 [Streptomyces sp. NPDC056637]|uniref:hypothetical protein n=1 Tax=unclassified Streptomyces TaxID=2593676 RepID=UPI0036BF2F86